MCDTLYGVFCSVSIHLARLFERSFCVIGQAVTVSKWLQYNYQ